MNSTRLHALTLAIAGGAVLSGFPAAAQGADEAGAPAQFAAPKRIQAGDVFLGEGRLYPSPVLHDVDGDQLPDIVIGDLFGKVTFAKRTVSLPSVVFAAEQALKDRSGEQLKFHNW